jgi:glutaredoxin
MMSAIRYILGQIILFLDWITRPRRPKHPPQVQQALDDQTKDLTLYQFHLCPFCVKTRRAIHRLGLNIETRDAKRDPGHKQDLVTQGGQYKVPCLAIKEDGETRWMYESSDIISYLEQRFSQV